MQATPYWEQVRNLSRPSSPSPQPLPTCPLCDGMGMYLPDVPLTDPNFGKVIMCECQREARTRHLMAGIEAMLGSSADFSRHRDSSFDTFQALNTLDGKDVALNLAQQFARGDVTLGGVTKRGLVLYGPCGVGKTGLAISALRERALLGESIMMIKFDAFIRQVQRGYGDEAGTSDQLIDAATNAELLYIDDAGDQDLAGAAKDDKRRNMLLILEPRHARNAPTLITMNLDPTAFYVQFGNRLYQRVIELCHWAEVGGEVLRS